MPLPLNQKTKRFGTAPECFAVSAAYAVPVALNIEISGGSPTIVVAPFRRDRRDKRKRLVITCDIERTPCYRILPRCDQSNYHLPKIEIRLSKLFGRPI